MVLDNKIKQIKTHINRNKTSGLRLLTFGIIALYALFFLSSLLPDGSVVQATVHLTEIKTKDGNIIRLMRSQYSAKDKKIQYELDVKNIVLYPYSFVVKIRDKSGNVKRYEPQIVVQESYICVFNINEVSDKWEVIQIEVNGIKANGNQSVTLLADMYSDRHSISEVDSIDDKSINEYKIDRAYVSIEEYRAGISELQEKNNSIWYEIGLLQKANEQLKKEKEHQTENEIVTTNNMIQSNNSSILNHSKTIQKNEADIKEYEDKIIKSQELIDDLSSDQ